MRRLLPAIVGALLGVAGVSAWQGSVWSPINIAALNRVLVTQDFDNDGIPDRLRVHQAGVGIALSRDSHDVSRLGHRTPVVGFVAIDVDCDGDADVLTLTAAGNLWVWRNDGRGRFAAERVVPNQGLPRSLPDSLGRPSAPELTLLSDDIGRGYRPLGLSSFAGVAPVLQKVGAKSQTGLALSFESSRSSASPRAPPAVLAIA